MGNYSNTLERFAKNVLAPKFGLSYEGIHTIVWDGDVDATKITAAKFSGSDKKLFNEVDLWLQYDEDGEVPFGNGAFAYYGPEIESVDGEMVHGDMSDVLFVAPGESWSFGESTKEKRMNKLNERVFTDRDFDNRMQPKAKPGEIWSAVQNLQDMFESAKKDGDRRMKENLVSFNNRRIDSFKETGLKNVSDAELKAEYRRRFGESAESKKKRLTESSGWKDSDIEEINDLCAELDKGFYLRKFGDNLCAIAKQSDYDYQFEDAEWDIRGFLEKHFPKLGDFNLAWRSEDGDPETEYVFDIDTVATGNAEYDEALKFVNSNWNDFFNGDTVFEDSLGDTDVRVEIEDGWISITKLSMSHDDELFSGDAEEFKELGPAGVAERIAADL